MLSRSQKRGGFVDICLAPDGRIMTAEDVVKCAGRFAVWGAWAEVRKDFYGAIAKERGEGFWSEIGIYSCGERLALGAVFGGGLVDMREDCVAEAIKAGRGDLHPFEREDLVPSRTG